MTAQSTAPSTEPSIAPSTERSIAPSIAPTIKPTELPTEVPETETTATVSSLVPTIANTSHQTTTESSVETPITTIRDIETNDSLTTTEPLALTTDKPVDPLTLTELGIPIKVDRFGLEPLPYPMKTSNSKFQILPLRNPNSLLRRFGELPQTTTEIDYTTGTAIENLTTNQYRTATEKSTVQSTQASNDMIEGKTFREEVREENNEYSDSESDIIEESDVFSPTPIYRPTSPAAPDKVVDINTTPKSTFLHNEEFAKALNNMYYENPEEMFEPMMERINASLRALN